MKEIKIPLIFSIVLTAILGLLESQSIVAFKNFDKLIDTSINIAGILLGFLITVQGILVSMSGSQIMTVLRQAKKLKELTDKLKVAIAASTFLLVYSLYVLVLDFPSLTEIQYLPLVKHLVWFFLIILLAASCFRFVSIFIGVISSENEV